MTDKIKKMRLLAILLTVGAICSSIYWIYGSSFSEDNSFVMTITSNDVFFAVWALWYTMIPPMFCVFFSLGTLIHSGNLIYEFKRTPDSSVKKRTMLYGFGYLILSSGTLILHLATLYDTVFKD